MISIKVILLIVIYSLATIAFGDPFKDCQKSTEVISTAASIGYITSSHTGTGVYAGGILGVRVPKILNQFCHMDYPITGLLYEQGISNIGKFVSYGAAINSVAYFRITEFVPFEKKTGRGDSRSVTLGVKGGIEYGLGIRQLMNDRQSLSTTAYFGIGI